MITENTQLPLGQLQELHQGSIITHDTSELFANKKVIVFALPGAFTPTCSKAHLPGFVVHAEQIKAKGIDDIICLSVNDAFVMSAWGEANNAEHIKMLADGDGLFTQALGLANDSGKFGGIRSRRYAMIVDNNLITHLQVEKPKEFQVSSAEAMLALL